MGSQPTPKILQRTRKAAGTVLYKHGRITYPELFIEMGILRQKDLKAWRQGQVPFLERVVQSNLTKLARIQKALRKIAREQNLNRRLANRPKRPYSKSRHPFVEEEYRAVYRLTKADSAVRKGFKSAKSGSG